VDESEFYKQFKKMAEKLHLESGDSFKLNFFFAILITIINKEFKNNLKESNI